MDTSFDEGIKRTFDMLAERLSIVEERTARAERAAIFAESLKYGTLNNEIFGTKFPIIRAAEDGKGSEKSYPFHFSECRILVIFKKKCGCKTDKETTDLPLYQKAMDTLFSGSKFTVEVLDKWSVHMSTIDSGTPQLHEYISTNRLIITGLGHATECVRGVIILDSHIKLNAELSEVAAQYQ